MSEGFLIEDLAYVYSDDIDAYEQGIFNESYLKPLQGKYALVEKFLYTYDPNNAVSVNTIGNKNIIGSISINEEHLNVLSNNASFIQKEVGCHYIVEDNTLILVLI
jgi:hypothetical protein